MIPADVKANKNKRTKISGGCILKIFIRNTLKTWNTMYKRYLILVDILPILILSVKNRQGGGGGGEGLLKDKIG